MSEIKNMERVITNKCLEEFRQIMVQREKSRYTIEKYMRDIRKLQDFWGNKNYVVCSAGDKRSGRGL